MKHEIRESVILNNENEKIFAVFHKPFSSKEKFPAILVCHGFGGQKTGRYRLYVSLAEELAKNGIAVLRLDFRGCGDSEGDFLNTTLQGEVSDALKGLEFLYQHPEIDSERIGIFGRSLGGAVAVLAAKKFANIKSLALWAPMFSAESWQEKWELLQKADLNDHQRHEMLVMNGQVVGMEFLKQLFEMRLDQALSSLKAVPLLHVNAEQDQIVKAEHAKKYQMIRQEAEAESEFISMPKSDHDFSHAGERQDALNKTVSWFIKTLK